MSKEVLGTIPVSEGPVVGVGHQGAAIADLIKRLEKTTLPDRNLDAEIACAVKFTNRRPAKRGDHAGVYDLTEETEHPGRIYTETGFLSADHYTRSIDDARKIVPRGWSWEVRQSGFNNMPSQACVWNPRRTPGASNDIRVSIDADAPAIALCIVGLKALEALNMANEALEQTP